MTVVVLTPPSLLREFIFSQLFFRRLQRFGYLQFRMTAAELMNKSDHDLFCKLCAR